MASHISGAARQRMIGRAGALTIAVNLSLTVLRGLGAFLAGSTAVMADAANSGTDILATLVVLGGSRIAALPPDWDHPYGHEKAEPVAAKFVGILVTLTGVLTGVGALQALQAGAVEVSLLAAGVSVVSIAAKEVLARYLTRLGQRIGSQAVLADAANQRTDVLASLAALVGALGGCFGFPVLDPAMGLLVSGLILRMGLGLYWRAVRDLMDRAPDRQTMAALVQAALSVPGVRAVGDVRARVFGPSIYADCKISVDGTLSVAEGHRIGKRVKRAIMRAVPECRNVMVHVNPYPGLEPGPDGVQGARRGLHGAQGAEALDSFMDLPDTLEDLARDVDGPEGAETAPRKMANLDGLESLGRGIDGPS